MTLWMLWSVAVGSLVGAGALLAERVLLSRGRPLRWAWVAGMVCTAALQLWPWLRPDRSAARLAAESLAGGLPLLEVGNPDAAGPSALRAAAAMASRADAVLAVAWPVASVLLLALLGLALLRLRRMARGWPRHRTAWGEVRLSEDFGPALVGVLSPVVVMPAWAFRLEEDLLHATLLHEAEHRVARDTLTVFAAAALVALAPWNPALWWMAARLRQAVELDCDARVLAAGISRARYGRLLLEISARAGPLPFAATALGRSRSLLERRMTMIARSVRFRLLPHAAALLGLGLLVFVVACEAPAPTSLQPSRSSAEGTVGDVAPLSPRAQEAQEFTRGVAFRSGRPLILVDGERSPLSLEELDATRIQRIEVLRGEAARLRYGTEGADGVVLVWTSETAEAPTLGSAMDDYAPEADRPTSERVSFSSLPEGMELFVNGEPFDGELEDLDPDTIDRIEVIRGEDGGRVLITLK